MFLKIKRAIIDAELIEVDEKGTFQLRSKQRKINTDRDHTEADQAEKILRATRQRFGINEEKQQIVTEIPKKKDYSESPSVSEYRQHLMSREFSTVNQSQESRKVVDYFAEQPKQRKFEVCSFLDDRTSSLAASDGKTARPALQPRVLEGVFNKTAEFSRISIKNKREL
jgi:hypothetical protein